jgi:hypothetical protein
MPRSRPELGATSPGAGGIRVAVGAASPGGTGVGVGVGRGSPPIRAKKLRRLTWAVTVLATGSNVVVSGVQAETSSSYL